MFQKVADKVWFIEGLNSGRYPYSHSLFINDTTKVLIDTGIGRPVIKNLLKEFGQPDIILYSHAHEDHIYEKTLFSTTARFIHELDKPAAESKAELYRLYGIDTSEFAAMLDAFLKSFHYAPLENLKIFKNSQIFELGTLQVKVIHTPGHSGGHCCFEIPQEKIIFASDIDLTTYGPWYGALDSNIQAFEQSIAALLQKPPEIIITSHKGLITDDIPGRLTRYLSIIQEREANVLQFLDQPRTLKEMVPHALIQGKFGEPVEYYMAAERIMLQKHLDRLLTAHKVIFSKGQYQKN
jgi:glyoxylase-like metal-dependent hydrolase (beta-lactamase superfamily II)